MLRLVESCSKLASVGGDDSVNYFNKFVSVYRSVTELIYAPYIL